MLAMRTSPGSPEKTKCRSCRYVLAVWRQGVPPSSGWSRHWSRQWCIRMAAASRKTSCKHSCAWAPGFGLQRRWQLLLLQSGWATRTRTWWLLQIIVVNICTTRPWPLEKTAWYCQKGIYFEFAYYYHVLQNAGNMLCRLATAFLPPQCHLQPYSKTSAVIAI